MAEAGHKVCRTESLRSANEHAVRRRGTRCWRGGVACVLAGVQWNEGGLMCRRSLCVRPSEVPRFTDAPAGYRKPLRNSTRNSHNAGAC